jgi:hypothetical protein
MNVAGCEKRGLVEESRWVDFGMAAMQGAAKLWQFRPPSPSSGEVSPVARAQTWRAAADVFAILAVFPRHLDTL